MQKKSIKILAIESSCDDTCAAVIEAEGLFLNEKIIRDIKPTVLSNIISSQVKLHAQYGGVYPELASREHLKNILPVIHQAIRSNKVRSKTKIISTLNPYSLRLNAEIDCLAITTGPGLIGSLLPGVNTAKTLSYIFNKPIYPVNHLAGHIYANFIGANPKSQALNPKPLPHTPLPHAPIQFPLIALVVSGGHTSLVYMKNHLDYKVIGETLDDAAGEAFDKLAKMLDLGYPGGPVVSQLADRVESGPVRYALQSIAGGKSKVESRGLFPNETPVDRAIKFPRPMINSDNFDFSFSGLKTSALYTIQKLPKPLTPNVKSRICQEFQAAIVETLVSKTIRAAKKYKVKTILLSGGVAANDLLRKNLQLKAYSLGLNFSVPPKNLCTDNAAMIGAVAAYKIAFGVPPTPWYNVNSDSNSKLESNF
jgi:N6-L-threonylcarbamoyladenine synthase